MSSVTPASYRSSPVAAKHTAPASHSRLQAYQQQHHTSHLRGQMGTHQTKFGLIEPITCCLAACGCGPLAGIVAGVAFLVKQLSGNKQ